MSNSVAAAAVVLLAFIGCGKSGEPSEAPPDSRAPQPAKSVAKTAPKPAPQSAPAKPPLDERKYGRWTHLEWAARIKDLDPQGPEAPAAVDGLIALIRDHDVPAPTRTTAAILLGRMGKTAASAVPVFRELLTSNRRSNHPFDIEVMHWSIRALALLGPVAKDATPELVAILEDPTRPFVLRAGCLEALARIGDAEAKAIHALIRMLSRRFHRNVPRDEAHMLRGFSIDAIALVGPPAAAAIRDLIRLSRSEQEDLRRKAATALGAMGPEARDSLIPLAELLTQDDSPAVREAAANALANIGPLAVPLLRKLIEDDDAEVRRHAARGLGQIGKPAAPAIDELDFALDDDDGWVRIYAAESLWKITRKPDRVVPAYVEELKNPNRQIRIKAYRLLRDLGKQAAGAKLGLQKLLSDKRPYVRAVARRALRNLETAR